MNINEKRKFILKGENKNIFTKTGIDTYYSGSICENELDKSIEEHKWKIKILKSKYKDIMIGVAPIDFDFNEANYNTCGWYLWCRNSPPTLYSGPPFNYKSLKTNLDEITDEVVVVMNMKKADVPDITVTAVRGICLEGKMNAVLFTVLDL